VTYHSERKPHERASGNQQRAEYPAELTLVPELRSLPMPTSPWQNEQNSGYGRGYGRPALSHPVFIGPLHHASPDPTLATDHRDRGTSAPQSCIHRSRSMSRTYESHELGTDVAVEG
jgi:hypothetical protein